MKLVIKLQILFIKAVTILFKVVLADDLKQQQSFYKHGHYALAYTLSLANRLSAYTTLNKMVSFFYK